MILASWNINSVRIRTNQVIDYLKKKKIDILVLQEIKTEDQNFPHDDFKKEGYYSYSSGQKSYNGVAIISKKKLKVSSSDFKDPLNQSRYISAEIEYKKKIFSLISIYLPNGNPVNTDKYEYKKKWMDLFEKFIKTKFKKNKNIIITGDFNVIPSEEDVDNPEGWSNDALFKLEIRKKFRSLLTIGFKDGFRLFNKEAKQYTFWDYQQGSWQRNKGLRIDHYLISDNMVDSLKVIEIDKFTRDNERPSDHVPIRCVLT
jgi:exodeoxyribonuclease III